MNWFLKKRKNLFIVNKSHLSKINALRRLKNASPFARPGTVCSWQSQHLGLVPAQHPETQLHIFNYNYKLKHKQKQEFKHKKRQNKWEYMYKHKYKWNTSAKTNAKISDLWPALRCQTLSKAITWFHRNCPLLLFVIFSTKRRLVFSFYNLFLPLRFWTGLHTSEDGFAVCLKINQIKVL